MNPPIRIQSSWRTQLVDWKLAVSFVAILVFVVAVPAILPNEGESTGSVMGLACGIALIVDGYLRRRRTKRIGAIPERRVADAAIGPVHVVGRAERDHSLRAPFSDRPCSLWECRVEEEKRHGWAPIDVIKSIEAFEVVDDSGRITVSPNDASVELRQEHEEIIQLDESNREKFARFLRYYARLGWRSATGPVRVIEGIIPLGSPVRIIGQVTRGRWDPLESKRAFLETLRAAKANPREMDAADLNGDGTVDEQEWDAFRRRKEQEHRRREAHTPESLMVRHSPHQPLVISAVDDKKRIAGGWLMLAGAAVFVSIIYVASRLPWLASLAGFASVPG